MSCLSCIGLILLAVVGFVLFKCWPIMKKLFFFSTKKWENTPKDVLIVHCIGRGICIPNPSPFVMKLETYLRMANIPYEIDEEDSFGPKGKTPWITLNGKHITDSQVILEFLNKRYEKDLSSKLTKEQRALARTIRIMMEEHAFWGLLHWRWIGGVDHGLKIMNIPQNIFKILKFIMGRKISNQLWAQGMGRFSFEQMTEMALEDFRNLSTLLGNKKFLMGDEPCEEDCAIFGLLCEALWAGHGSAYEKIMNDELTNLKEYCIRMKEKYWPDWDKLCVKKNL